MMRSSSIGLFGGTFNPVHHGHIIQARITYEALKLEKLLVVPSGVPPFKAHDPSLAPFEMRFRWTQIAFSETEGMEVWDFEGRHRDQISYTIQTVREIHRLYQVYPWLIMGVDAFAYIDKWHSSEFLIKHCPIAVLCRPGDHQNHFPHPEGEVTYLKTPLIEISSSMIRQRAQSGLSLRGWVPESIEEEIRQWYRDHLNTHA